MPENRARRNGFAARLLAWYDDHARDLPWRVGPQARAQGRRPDPYRVWLSEIMLQQTTVEAVKPYFARFLAAWPDLRALAAAPEEAVFAAWAGLGYYSRARNLVAAARALAARPDGAFPDTAEALSALPGVGAYTAAAIAAIAFDRPEAVIDGNVERVIARHLAIAEPLPAARRAIRAALERLVPDERPGDFAQAMMDLGATVCAPRRADCPRCPLAADCAGRGNPLALPVRPPRAARPRRRAAAYVAVDRHGAVLLRRRPGRGLLAGMAEPPTSTFSAAKDGATGPEAAPLDAAWRRIGTVSHVFTHFSLDLAVWRADLDHPVTLADTWWASRSDLAGEALPTVMRKALALALDEKEQP